MAGEQESGAVAQIVRWVDKLIPAAILALCLWSAGSIQAMTEAVSVLTERVNTLQQEVSEIKANFVTRDLYETQNKSDDHRFREVERRLNNLEKR